MRARKPQAIYDLPTAEMRYTRHQVLRGTLPDAEDAKHIYLLKAPAELKVTYQIKMCTCLARNSGKKLVLQVSPKTRKSERLAAYLKEHKETVVWRTSS